jgi:hypothetical protein
MNSKKEKKTFFLHLFFGVVCAVFLAIFFLFAGSADVITSFLSLCSVLLLLWLPISWKVTNRPFLDFYPLFLVGTVLFLLSLPALFSFRIADFSDAPWAKLWGNNPRLLNMSILMAVASVWALHAGALFVFSKNKLRFSDVRIAAHEIRDRDIRSVMVLLGFALAIMVAPGAILHLLDVLKSASTQGYNSLASPLVIRTGTDAVGHVFSAFLVPAAFMLIIGGKNKPIVPKLGVAIVSLYCLTYILAGDRSVAIVVAGAALILWDREVYHVPRMPLAICILVCVVLVLPFISMARQESLVDFRNLIPVIREIGFGELVKHGLLQMGGSLRTVYWAVELFPEHFTYGLGETYLWSLTKIFPNLFWDLHPSVGHSVASTITHEVNPVYAARGGGYGSSFATEAYANFGFCGIAVAFGIGWVLQRMSMLARLGSPLMLFFVAVGFTGCFELVRGESAGVVRAVAWHALVPAAAVLVVQRTCSARRFWASGKQRPAM